MAKKSYFKNGYTLSVYSDGRGFYVRLIKFETPKFPHGIALHPTFDSEEDANKHVDFVAEYMGLEKDKN